MAATMRMTPAASVCAKRRSPTSRPMAALGQPGPRLMFQRRIRPQPMRSYGAQRCAPGGFFMFGPQGFRQQVPFNNGMYGGNPRAWAKVMRDLGFGISNEMAAAFEKMAQQQEASAAQQQPSNNANASDKADVSGNMSLQVDVREDELSYHITADVPGISKEDIKLQMTPPSKEGTCKLTITATRRAVEPADDVTGLQTTVRQTERPQGTFSRSLELPSDAMREGVKAQTASGVLTVTIPRAPKVEPEQPPTVDIPIF